jgi:hypothetical protein
MIATRTVRRPAKTQKASNSPAFGAAATPSAQRALIFWTDMLLAHQTTRQHRLKIARFLGCRTIRYFGSH